MTDLLELFHRNPKSLSEKDLDTQIEELRKLRHHFNAAGVKASPAAVAKAKTASVPNLDFEL